MRVMRIQIREDIWSFFRRGAPSFKFSGVVESLFPTSNFPGRIFEGKPDK